MTGPIARERLNWSEFKATAFGNLGPGHDAREHGLIGGRRLRLGETGEERDDEDGGDPEMAGRVEEPEGRGHRHLEETARRRRMRRRSKRSATAPPTSMNAMRGTSEANGAQAEVEGIAHRACG